MRDTGRKSEEQIAGIHAAGQVVAQALAAAETAAACHVPTCELDRIVARVIAQSGADAVIREPRGGHAFPATCSVSINEEITGGVPGTRRFADGDLVTVDTACRRNGWCADAARTFIIGKASQRATRLMTAACSLTMTAISELEQADTWSEVVARLQEEARRRNVVIATGFAGHGIGRDLHEPPTVPFSNDGKVIADFEIRPGLVITIEPVVMEWRSGITFRNGGKTACASPGTLSAYVEHTVAVTDSGIAVLTSPA